MKKAVLYILALTAAVLVSWGIWKNHHENEMAEEREKFQAARENFVKMEEQYVPDRLADLDYFRSAEVSAENTLKPTQYDEDDLIWVEEVTVTVSVEDSFDALKGRKKFSFINEVYSVAAQAIENVQREKIPEYAAYRKYRKNAFPGYENQTVTYVEHHHFYVKTAAHTYEYTDFYTGTRGSIDYERFYKMDGDLVRAEDEDDGSAYFNEDEDLTEDSQDSSPDNTLSSSEDAAENTSSSESSSGFSGGVTVKRGASRRSTKWSEEHSGDSSAKTGTSSGSGDSSGSADDSANKSYDYEDDYNVNDYDDPEDFYEDNADDFEDEEDAEDYYDEYHE